MSSFTDRAINHLRENIAPTSDLGRLFRATGHMRLGVDESGSPH